MAGLQAGDHRTVQLAVAVAGIHEGLERVSHLAQSAHPLFEFESVNLSDSLDVR